MLSLRVFVNDKQIEVIEVIDIGRSKMEPDHSFYMIEEPTRCRGQIVSHRPADGWMKLAQIVLDRMNSSRQV